MRRLLSDERIPPLAVSALFAASGVYWIAARVRCGEDECIDRTVVSGIVSSVWIATAALIIWAPVSRPQERTAFRWGVALLWPLAAWVLLYVLPFGVVYD